MHLELFVDGGAVGIGIWVVAVAPWCEHLLANCTHPFRLVIEFWRIDAPALRHCKLGLGVGRTVEHRCRISVSLVRVLDGVVQLLEVGLAE
jgi:hypothetical protein